MTLTESVFRPDAPQTFRDRESAVRVVADEVVERVTSKYRKNDTFRLGTAGSGALVMVEDVVGGTLLSSQYVFLIDEGHSVHRFYWYSR